MNASCKNGSHDIAGNIGESEIAACVAEGPPGMIQAEQMEDRGVEIVDVNAVLHAVSNSISFGTDAKLR